MAIVEINARLVGNVTGKIYAVSGAAVDAIFKEPEVYIGEILLAIPFEPSETSWPEFDPEDTAVKIQFRTNSENTRFGRSTVNPFPYIGHWHGWVERRPRADIELPNGGIS